MAGLALRALFEEPAAREIPSLVELTGSSTLLAVFAHPDDEILVAATLADAADRGCRVYSVTATRGEQGIPDGLAGARAQLVRLREGELREFGAMIGIREQSIWDFPDGRLEEVELGVLVDSVSSVIRRHEPDLVVTFDSSAGFTGHPDHRRIGAVVLRAVAGTSAAARTAGDGPRPRWVAQVLFPRRAGLLVPKRELRRQIRGQPPADVAVRGNSRLRRLGMTIHRTQRQYFPPAWIRPLLDRVYDREHFALTRASPG